MKYVYNPQNRLHDVREYKTLASPIVLTLFLSSLSLGLICWSILLFIHTSTTLLLLTAFSTTISLITLTALVFASTYYPFQKPKITVQQVKKIKTTDRPINIAEAASFSMVETMGNINTKKKNDFSRFIKALCLSPHLKHFMVRLEIEPNNCSKHIIRLLTPNLHWDDFIKGSLDLADELNHPYLEPEHALGFLLLQPAIQPYLRSHNLLEEDLKFVLWWGAEKRQRDLFRQRWWDKDRLLAFTGIGMSWASGYTPLVDRLAHLPKGSYWDDVIYGHEKKVTDLINTLARQRQSNVLLVGDPGVGRLGIIRNLSKKIINSMAHPALNGERVIYINVAELVAHSKTGSGQLAILSQTLREMEEAGNIIAVLDGLSAILGESGEQRINLTDILLPFLSSQTVRVVVMITSEQYHLRLKSNQELMQYFEVVLVPSLSEAGTMKRLALTAPAIERNSRLKIPYKTIKTVVKDTSSILPLIPFPERAFDFLEEAIVLAQSNNYKTVQPGHVHAVISKKIGIDLGVLRAGEKQKLLDLEKLIHRRLVNQEDAVKTLSRAMIRARTQIRGGDRPIGAFLFLGPTGVGKTETAKSLASVYFGSEDHMLRLDMSEFQESDSVSRLIGSASRPVGRLTSLISEHPFTVLLLDEFEKADPQVHQLFLQVFDEGRLSDAAGRVYSFVHTIIIATSNAGAELIRQASKNGTMPADFNDKLKEYILQNNIFRPELLNRFDSVVTYSALTREHIKQIAKLMLESLNKRLDAEHGITVAIDEQLVNYLVKIGYNPEFGARPMNRAIQDSVEYIVSQMILKNQVRPGQKINLKAEVLQNYKQ